MKCANCGNENPVTLLLEDDTFYCNVCHHRTITATGQDDLITCPFCLRPRDRKATNCWWCNCSIDQTPGPSRELFEELDAVIQPFEDRMDSSNLIYGKILNQKRI